VAGVVVAALAGAWIISSQRQAASLAEADRARAEEIRAEARAYRDQGKASFTANVHTHLGYNWRMSEPHAAIGLSQLGRLDEFIAHRQRIAKIYDDALGELALTRCVLVVGPDREPCKKP